MINIFPLGEIPKNVGEMSRKMLAWCVRPDREGDPETAMKGEEVDVPAVGPNEALVLEVGAGVNFSGVWAGRGAAGGLGVFAVQICKMLGANPIAIVGGKDKVDLVKSLGASAFIDRNDYADLMYKPPETPERNKARMEACKRFGKRVRELTGGKDVDVVFEHVGQQTFPTSVFLAKKFGKIVICGATTGFNLEFDVRHLWMRQKQILGSHFANAYQAERANQLVHEGKIRPVLDQVFPFDQTAHAHALMAANKHKGKMGIAVQAAVAQAGLPQAGAA